MSKDFRDASAMSLTKDKNILAENYDFSLTFDLTTSCMLAAGGSTDLLRSL